MRFDFHVRCTFGKKNTNKSTLPNKTALPPIASAVTVLSPVCCFAAMIEPHPGFDSTVLVPRVPTRSTWWIGARPLSLGSPAACHESYLRVPPSAEPPRPRKPFGVTVLVFWCAHRVVVSPEWRLANSIGDGDVGSLRPLCVPSLLVLSCHGRPDCSGL